MATIPVTPIPLVNSIITIGETSVIAVAAGPNGGVITNPLSATDQGLVTAENLYINPVTAAGTVGNGTTFALLPGQSWTIVPGQTTPTYVNAPTSGHKLSGFSY
ncbi:MAG TPA: hypothetical protein VMV19_17655 [Xanthobacteraceae bacterium]|nr:hypothetical protein [Xanthobacteraceae bacterium]